LAFAGSAGSGGIIDWAAVPDSMIPVRVVSSPRGERRRPTRDRPGFVKGPLPLEWIVAATRCASGKGLPMLLALKAKADASREDWVKPPAAVLNSLGFDRAARSRTISALEKAGLIEVQRRKGRPPLVRLLPWHGGSGS
jgi:DNA-binding transcriptional ArsR family regulator